MEMDSCRIKLFVGSVAVGHYTLHLLSDGRSVLEYQSVDCASTPPPHIVDSFLYHGLLYTNWKNNKHFIPSRLN